MIRTDEFLAMLDIVAVAGRHVELKRSGAGYLGLCPIHAEKTPSFRVDPKRQTFKCFGCGKGGDAIALYRELFGLGFLDACAKLADENGIDLHSVKSTVTEEGRQALKLAEAELPAFDAWMRLRIEYVKGEIQALRDSWRVRRTMAREVEKLASGDSGLSPERVEAMREAWFAQVGLCEAIRDTVRRLEKQLDRLELEPEGETDKFLQAFYASGELRAALRSLRGVQ